MKRSIVKTFSNYRPLRCFVLCCITLHLSLLASCETAPSSLVWQNFKDGSKDNILPDFSYAGYKFGEEAVPLVDTLGYKIFDVTEFGAIADDGLSDRAAFERTIAAVEDNGGGVIYFPEGLFDIHTADDPDKTIPIRSSNTIIKGAGRDLTTILVSAPNHPSDPDKLWTSPTVIVFAPVSRDTVITEVVSNAQRNTFSVEVASTSGLKRDDWVNIALHSNDPELVECELGEYYHQLSPDVDIKKSGVKIDDFHQIKSIDGNVITFYEPIIYAIDSRWKWRVKSYSHLVGVGVEDLTLQGDCVPDYEHHRTWNDDGGYKPLAISRAVDSWIRRVNFVSVSEAASIILSARVSAYDINISGKRGHSAIRSQNSVRTFIGKVFDYSDSEQMVGAGQWHAVGVSNSSLGAVLWRNEWGLDSNFESHASQPRATLFDNCKGGFLRLRQGGAEKSLPNHLGDLVIWNFNATATEPQREWQWWDSQTKWTRFLPAIVVGFHGEELVFDSSQQLVEELHGRSANPESLYEEQLKLRLGAIPQWLVELKGL